MQQSVWSAMAAFVCEEKLQGQRQARPHIPCAICSTAQIWANSRCFFAAEAAHLHSPLRGLKWRQPSQSSRIPVLLTNPRPTWLIASSLHLFLPNRRQSRQSTFHPHISFANRRQPPSTLMSERCVTAKQPQPSTPTLRLFLFANRSKHAHPRSLLFCLQDKGNHDNLHSALNLCLRNGKQSRPSHSSLFSAPSSIYDNPKSSLHLLSAKQPKPSAVIFAHVSQEQNACAQNHSSLHIICHMFATKKNKPRLCVCFSQWKEVDHVCMHSSLHYFRNGKPQVQGRV